MITPSYSPTATERVLPRMALDFTTAVLDSRVTVTRALNTATRVNSSGLIETVNANLPRFDFNLNTGGACKGLLIEEGRTNALLSSGDASSADWSTFVNGSATVSRTGASGTAPDGTNTATLIDVTATGSDQAVVQQVVYFSAATSYAASFYVKAYTANDVGKIIVFRHIGNSSYTSATLTADWARPSSVETNASTGSSTLSIGLRPGVGSSSGNVKFLLWGGQFELGAFPSSYIPTTTTTSARNADVVSMTGTNFSDWYNTTEGTFMANVSSSGVYSFNSVIDANDGTSLNRIGIRYNSASVASGLIIVNNIQQGPVNPAAPNASASKFVLAYKANSFAASYRGSTVATDTSGTVPTVSQLEIGNFLATNGSQINGHFIQLSYYPLRLTNNEVQAFSK
jgi:hypothetical protein